MRNPGNEIFSMREAVGSRQLDTRISILCVRIRRVRSSLRWSLAVALFFGTVIPSVSSASLSASLSTTPIEIAPAGRMGYSLSVMNNSTSAADAKLSLSFDSHLTFVASYSHLVSCTRCTTEDDCGIPCVEGGAGDCPPTPTPAAGTCSAAGICATSGDDSCVVIDPDGTGMTLGNLASGAYKRVILEFEIAADTPLSDKNQHPITNQIESMVTVEAYPEGSSVGSTTSTTVTKTSVTEGNKAPLQGGLSATPPGFADDQRARPGEDILYRIMVQNNGALSRDITMNLAPDSALTIVEVAAQRICTTDGQCFDQCSAPGVASPAGCFDSTNAEGTTYPFLSVAPGQLVQLRVGATIAADTIKTQLASMARFTDGRTELEVSSGDVHTRIDVCTGRVGDVCDNGDACQDDTCSADGKCSSPTCVEACKDKPDGTSCNEDGDLCKLEVCETGRCVAKQDPSGEQAYQDCTGGCQICDSDSGCIINTASDTVCREAQGPCERDLLCTGLSPTCPSETESYLGDGASCGDDDPSTPSEVCVAQVSGPPQCLSQGSCGDGFTDPDEGEECDDGDQLDGDCCSALCTFEPAGASCGNGNVCDGEETCNGAGACQSGTPLVPQANSICESAFCDPVLGIQEVPEPASNCHSFAKAKLVVNEVREGHESLSLDLRNGPDLDQAVFGAPTSAEGEAYSVCFYRNDNDAFAGELRLPALPNGGSTCGTRRCWKTRKSIGYHYRDKDYATDGIGALKLSGGAAGRSRIALHGRNNVKKSQTSLPHGRVPPNMGIAARLDGSFAGALVQIRRDDDASCFEADLSAVVRSGPVVFKARK